MTAPCPHGFAKPASCFECMEDGNIDPPARPAPATREGPDIPARYDGHCNGCNLGVHIGQPICRTTHGTYEHAHHHPEAS